MEQTGSIDFTMIQIFIWKWWKWWKYAETGNRKSDIFYGYRGLKSQTTSFLRKKRLQVCNLSRCADIKQHM